MELNILAGGEKGDFFTIAKLDRKWYFVNLVWGLLDENFCFDDYQMDNVSYEENIYCIPQSEKKEASDKYIILQKKSNGKYGVLSLVDMKTIIPFDYDNISFVEGDKSKARTSKVGTNETKVFSLNRHENNTIKQAGNFPCVY